MNCLNREQIQLFIDEELPITEMIQLDEHIQHCASCSQKVMEAKGDIEECFAFVNSNAIPESDICVPDFVAPKKKVQKPKIYRLRNIAASVVIIFSLAGGYKILSTQEEVPLHSSELEWELMNSNSANTQWQNRDMVISIIDENGKLILLSEI